MIRIHSGYFAIAFVWSAKYQVFDYSAWSEKLYGGASFIMAPIHEFLLNILLVLATAVAFATGGATLAKVAGTPYLLNTVVIAGVIFVLTIYGAELVRKAATLTSLVLIACIFIIYLPNIIYFYPKIVANFAAIKSGEIIVGSEMGFLDTLWWGIKYAGLQCCLVGAYIVHTNACPDKACLKKATIVGFIINTGIMYITYFGIMAFVDQGALKEAVPSVFVVMNGVGGASMTVLISICIVLGAVSTGVNLVYSTTNRMANFLGRNLEETEQARKRGTHCMISSIILVLICWMVAQFGLIPLIGKGYNHIGKVALAVVMLPVFLRGFGIWRFADGRKFI